jgi:hypothetical protein
VIGLTGLFFLKEGHVLQYRCLCRKTAFLVGAYRASGAQGLDPGGGDLQLQRRLSVKIRLPAEMLSGNRFDSGLMVPGKKIRTALYLAFI